MWECVLSENLIKPYFNRARMSKDEVLSVGSFSGHSLRVHGNRGVLVDCRQECVACVCEGAGVRPKINLQPHNVDGTLQVIDRG